MEKHNVMLFDRKGAHGRLNILDFPHQNVLCEGYLALTQYFSMEKQLQISVEPSIFLDLWVLSSWCLGLSVKQKAASL